MWFQKISIPLPRREFQLSPPTSLEFPFFKKKNNSPPPLRNFQKHFAHPPAPLEKVILKRNCANVLNIRPLSLINMTCVLPTDHNISLWVVTASNLTIWKRNFTDNPLLSGISWAFDPPPPKPLRNFQFPSWWGYGYFLEPHDSKQNNLC